MLLFLLVYYLCRNAVTGCFWTDHQKACHRCKTNRRLYFSELNSSFGLKYVYWKPPTSSVISFTSMLRAAAAYFIWNKHMTQETDEECISQYHNWLQKYPKLSDSIWVLGIPVKLTSIKFKLQGERKHWKSPKIRSSFHLYWSTFFLQKSTLSRCEIHLKTYFSARVHGKDVKRKTICRTRLHATKQI